VGGPYGPGTSYDPGDRAYHVSAFDWYSPPLGVMVVGVIGVVFFMGEKNTCWLMVRLMLKCTDC